MISKQSLSVKNLFIKAILISGVVAINMAFMPVKTNKAEKSKNTLQAARDKILKNGEKPNVLFIAIDDLNDWIGCFGGNQQVKTPNFDKFNAEGGMIMYKAHAPATVCCPSRSALLTGVHAHKTGVYGNNNNLKYAPKAKDLVTLPEYFSQNGYLSLTMGKIFHKHELPGDASNQKSDQGQWAFDEYYKTLGGVGPISSERPVNGLPNLEDENLNSYHAKAFDWGPTKGNDETQMLDYKTSKWAAEQFKNRDFEKPFFMAVGISKPHLTWYVPQKYFDMYPLDEIEVPETIPDDLNDILDKNGIQAFSPHATWRRVEKYGRHKEAVRAYLATITFVDDCIGILLDGLANSKYADNTIVMLWGDHGWHLGEKQKYGKTQLWQESCRVPMMVKVPDVTPNNKKCMGLVNLIDMYPTLIDLCDLPPNSKNDGRSFAGLLRDPDMEWNFPTLTTNRYKEHRIFDGRYSYINHISHGIEQLYDHQNDSMEWTNLILDPKFADVKKRLKAYLPDSDELESIRNGKWPAPVDTTRRVSVFPADTLLAWQYDFFFSNQTDTLFAQDSSNTIGIYGCDDTSGENIRSYADVDLFSDAAQFKWNTESQTFQVNGQWLKYSTKFINKIPYQLLLRARINVDAHIKINITGMQDDVHLFKDVSLQKDFTDIGGGNDQTNWFLSNFALTDLWGEYTVRFDWYDNIGEPGIFGGFSFVESVLDITPPEWYFVSIGALNIGTDIVVMTTEDAKVYLVPEGTSPDTLAIKRTAVAVVNTVAYGQAQFSTNDLIPGNYIVYALDEAKNISEPSRLITLQYPVNSPKINNQEEIKISYNSVYKLITIQSSNELSQVNFYNILGKNVGWKKFTGKLFQLPSDILPEGIYIIQVRCTNGDIARKKITI